MKIWFSLMMTVNVPIPLLPALDLEIFTSHKSLYHVTVLFRLGTKDYELAARANFSKASRHHRRLILCMLDPPRLWTSLGTED